MKPDEGRDNLTDRVHDWLATQGYPLEFDTAARLGKQGLRSRVGLYCNDADGTAREVDVVAFTPPASKLGTGFTNISGMLAVECKYSRDKPWIVLCQDEQRGFLEYLAMAILTDDARAGIIKASLADSGLIDACTFLYTPPSPAVGFSVVEAFRENNRDTPYNTVNKAIAAARYFASAPGDMLRRLEKQSNKPIHLWHFALPCVVLDAPLFAAAYDSASGTMRISQIPWARLHWMAGGATTAFIVTRDGLDAFAMSIVPVLNQFTQIAQQLTT